jgi:hypothetical protein
VIDAIHAEDISGDWVACANPCINDFSQLLSKHVKSDVIAEAGTVAEHRYNLNSWNLQKKIDATAIIYSNSCKTDSG